MSNLTNSEKGAIKKLLQDVKSRHITAMTVQGAHKYIKPQGVITRKIRTDDSTESSSSPSRAVSWINLPFFELKPYSAEKASPESFPAHTLLQADYDRHTEAREKKQAVQQIKDDKIPDRHYFHISQLWCVVVGNCKLAPLSWSPSSNFRVGVTRRMSHSRYSSLGYLQHLGRRRPPQGPNQGSVGASESSL